MITNTLFIWIPNSFYLEIGLLSKLCILRLGYFELCQLPMCSVAQISRTVSKHWFCYTDNTYVNMQISNTEQWDNIKNAYLIKKTDMFMAVFSWETKGQQNSTSCNISKQKWLAWKMCRRVNKIPFSQKCHKS